jgi:hypothetical protein
MGGGREGGNYSRNGGEEIKNDGGMNSAMI